MELPKNYDQWKLSTPEWYDDIEVFNADLPEYYHHSDAILTEFEEKVATLAKEMGISNSEDEAYERSK